jgi:hypothetical protein
VFVFGNSLPLEEFFTNIEGSARVGNSEDVNKIQVTALQLTDAAKQFYTE